MSASESRPVDPGRPPTAPSSAESAATRPDNSPTGTCPDDADKVVDAETRESITVTARAIDVAREIEEGNRRLVLWLKASLDQERERHSGPCFWSGGRKICLPKMVQVQPGAFTPH